jgi:hypothetical protein
MVASKKELTSAVTSPNERVSPLLIAGFDGNGMISTTSDSLLELTSVESMSAS